MSFTSANFSHCAAALSQQSLAFTRSRSVAGQLVRSETRTLPLTVTVSASVWTLLICKLLSVALPVVNTTSTDTSAARTQQLSSIVALNVTSFSQLASTSPPTMLQTIVGALASTTSAKSSHCAPGLPQQSVAFTRRRTVARQLVRSETSTLPVTVTV
ncbi:MAG: hypothetical protein CHACPFDD_03941 [Phycisphaerae bacterium]|nr:hypothetical protein [Phycisphaerae bacterium]